MALHRHSLELVALAASHTAPDSPAMLLSYPDVIASPADIGAVFGPHVRAGLKFRPDAAEILAWHEGHDVTDKVPETVHLFEQLGYDVDVIDITRARGCERVLDMNHPVPSDLLGKYNLVVDNVSDHCFNVGQALLNAAGMVTQRGFVLHCLPLAMLNHGFYNFNPTLFFDFYEQNGFEVVAYRAYEGVRKALRDIPVERSERIKLPLRDANQVVLARRLEVRPLAYPVQARIAAHPDCRKEAG